MDWERKNFRGLGGGGGKGGDVERRNKGGAGKRTRPEKFRCFEGGRGRKRGGRAEEKGGNKKEKREWGKKVRKGRVRT